MTLTPAGLEPPSNVSVSFLTRFSSTFKFLLIGFLILILLIPLGLVSGVISERKDRSQTVQKEITANWGGRQGVVGPMVIVPHQVTVKETANNDAERPGQHKYVQTTEYAHFLPEQLNVQVALKPEIRYRGIYQTVVYNGLVTLSGTFAPIGVAALKELSKDTQEKDIQWERAVFTVPINDLKGIQPNSTLVLNGSSLVFEPGKQFRGLQVPFKNLKTVSDSHQPISFKITLALNGSQEFSMAPTGKEAILQMTSPWKNPSFTGAYLPVQRQVNSQGFNATWKVSYFARNYPQAWTDTSFTDPVLLSSSNTGREFDNPQQPATYEADIANSAFGVSLIQPVDYYQQSERSVKYGILFLTLTFLTFFLFEVVANVRIHGIQYVLVGLALCLFYLLLLSLSEVIGFLGAYCVASVAIAALISFYSQGFLLSRKRIWVMPSLLLALYSYLYILLQLEDLSLLFGTIGLFIALTVVMAVTRKVDWFNRDQ